MPTSKPSTNNGSGSKPSATRPPRDRSDDNDDTEDNGDDNDLRDGDFHQQQQQRAQSSSSNTTSTVKGKQTAASANGADNEPPRTGRACLACRKLKTRCEDSETAPCKRCKLGGHECIFVESKRGKRPARNKPTDAVLAEKFRTVEKSLSTLLSTMTSGSTPDPATLQQLQASLQEGLAAGAAEREKSLNAASNGNDDSPSSSTETSTKRSANPPKKRARHDSSATAPPLPPVNNYSGSPSHVTHSPFINSTVALSPVSAGVGAPSSGRMSTRPLDYTPKSTTSSGSMPLPPVTAGSSLNVLADASLAAEIEGRSRLTGIDPEFTLSRITAAIMKDADGNPDEAETPSLLSQGVITPETAVEMFRLFFDWAYIHLPVLDPVYNSATSVCARSPFLFTAICAVASRFNADPTLHIRCYDEAHRLFLEMITTGERSVETVQACIILTVWGSAPKGKEDRPQRAWLYHGMTVLIALELGLFRPPAFVEQHLATNGNKANPWINIKNATEEEQREALNRERTWLMVFVIDRNIASVMGRPYQIQEAKPLLLPSHPMSLPFDLGIIAHQELQTIVGQIMDTFRDRIYGLPSASNDMPSPTVMKIFNSRMDEWQQRWCPVPGEPIANNLLFYFFSSKLFLNSIPLHTMLRNGDGSEDPASVSSTINAAKSILELGHEYAKLGVLLHCLDVNFLLMLYAAVFLVKVKVSNTRFAELVDSDELQSLLLQAIGDCQAAASSDRHAASTCYTLLRALFASWKAMSSAAAANHGSVPMGSRRESQHMSMPPNNMQQYGANDLPRFMTGDNGTAMGASSAMNPDGSPAFSFMSGALGLQGTLAGPGLPPSGPASPAAYPFLHAPFASRSSMSGAGGAAGASAGSGGGGGGGGYFQGGFNGGFASGSGAHGGGSGSGTTTPHAGTANAGASNGGHNATVTASGGTVGGGGTGSASASQHGGSVNLEPLDSFLMDTQFFGAGGLMVSQGADGFFSWPDGMDAAGGMDLNFSFDTTIPPVGDVSFESV